MSKGLNAPLAAALAMWAGAACADVAATAGSDAAAALPDPAADMAALSDKAAEDPALRQRLDYLRQLLARNSGELADEQNRQVLLATVAGVRGAADLPVNIRNAFLMPLAEARGQIAGTILSVDLDGDWRVTREELRKVIALKGGSQISDLFLLGDTNGDDVLDTDEMREVTELAAPNRNRGAADRALLPLFDFDGDGEFTLEELDRTQAALSYRAP